MQIEAFAVLAAVRRWASRFSPGDRVLFFIDNQAVWASLCKGSSRENDLNDLVSEILHEIDKSGIRPWFEWVPSKANIADLPSRIVDESLSPAEREEARKTLEQLGVEISLRNEDLRRLLWPYGLSSPESLKLDVGQALSSSRPARSSVHHLEQTSSRTHHQRADQLDHLNDRQGASSSRPHRVRMKRELIELPVSLSEKKAKSEIPSINLILEAVSFLRQGRTLKFIESKAQDLGWTIVKERRSCISGQRIHLQANPPKDDIFLRDPEQDRFLLYISSYNTFSRILANYQETLTSTSGNEKDRDRVLCISLSCILRIIAQDNPM